MYLHHQPICNRHARHLCQHLRAKQLARGGISFACHDIVKQGRGLGLREISSVGRWVAMVSRGCTQRGKIRTARMMGGKVALPCYSTATMRTEGFDIAYEPIK